jgi:hypothetical protein
MNITIKVGSEEVSFTKAVKVVKAGRKAPASHKMNAHIVCIAIGLMITGYCAFVPSDFALHFGAILATLPAFVQEFIDWLRDW